MKKFCPGGLCPSKILYKEKSVQESSVLENSVQGEFSLKKFLSFILSLIIPQDVPVGFGKSHSSLVHLLGYGLGVIRT